MHYLIVGLGNPGETYARTRHNAGAALVALFHDKNGFSPWRTEGRVKALVAEGTIGKTPVSLALPQNYMNASGPVVAALHFPQRQGTSIVVAHDDLDLPLGSVRISWGRSSGGHRGVESVIKSLRTKDFVRLRIGVAPRTSGLGGVSAKPHGESAVEKFILGRFAPHEQEVLDESLARACAALEAIVRDGCVSAMNTHNRDYRGNP